ncbi:MAG: hypothetical protein H7A44_12635 [Opitutaceae bacterium]|nr:hypothetical protein [Opitutaceae bacterium]
MSIQPDSFVHLRDSAGELLLAWARLLAPHYGATGSMDLDLRDWPDAAGPSFYNQFTPAALLLLADKVVPGATDEECARFRHLALRNLEYSAGLADADFHTPHFSRGRDWGAHIGEWLVYYQLCALRHLDTHGGATPELKQKLSQVVRGATGRAFRAYQQRFAGPATEFPGNHAVWHGLLFAAAGRYFDEQDWVQFADVFMQRHVLPFQDESGCWQEGGGVVVGYSLITALAVSLYAQLTGNEAAERAVDRAAAFHDFFLLPDGSTSTVADVRMRWHQRPFVSLPPGFASSQVGRVLATCAVARFRTALNEESVRDNHAQAFAFFGSACAVWFSADEGLPGRDSVRITSGSVARFDSEPWRAYLSWQLTPEWDANRFVLDAQNFIELWHRRGGYLAGTGNSKAMPRFSTLRRIDCGRAYVPDAAERDGDPAGLGAHYRFDQDVITVRLQNDQAELVLSVHAVAVPSGATYEFGLMLALRPGDDVCADGLNYTVEPTQLLALRTSFVWRGLTWRLPVGARLEYPMVPHNPYTQDGLPQPREYVARLSWPVLPGRSELRIQPVSSSSATP